MKNLSPDQSKIVEQSIDGAIQVLASAGAGKTRVLTERIKYILENTKKDSIIALTFTNKAAEEMKERLIGFDDLDERLWVGTIHGIAQHILERYAHTIGLPANLQIFDREQDRKTIFLEALVNSGINLDNYVHFNDDKSLEKFLKDCFEQFSLIKRDLLSENEVQEKKGDEVLRLYKIYQESLLESGGVDFDDILVYAHRILLTQSWCANIYQTKYKHVFVDEAQDLNKAQYEFIKVLCGEKIKSVMMVGDKNQMIYGFNGSSSTYLMDFFVRDFKPESFELKENYRSSRTVIKLANKLKPNSQTESQSALDGDFLFKELKDEREEAEFVADKIIEILDLKNHREIEGVISLKNMVVIGRNRFLFKTLEEVLSEKGIPYSLKKGEYKVQPDSIIGKVIDFGVKLHLNPKDFASGKNLSSVLNINLNNISMGDNLFDVFLNNIQDFNNPFCDVAKFALQEIQKIALQNPLIPKFCKNLVEYIHEKLTITVLNNEKEVERSLQEIDDFEKSWIKFKRKGLGDSLQAFRNAMALGQLAEDYNPDALTLSTVHTMKGLEKDIVFLIGMCDGVFPDYRVKSASDFEEERNNAFVAITRSKRWIYITYPKERKMPWGDSRSQNASIFFKEMEL